MKKLTKGIKAAIEIDSAIEVNNDRNKTNISCFLLLLKSAHFYRTFY